MQLLLLTLECTGLAAAAASAHASQGVKHSSDSYGERWQSFHEGRLA